MRKQFRKAKWIAGEKEKDLNLQTIITLAIVALLSATAAGAEVITKGGASGLMNPGRNQAEAPSIRTEAPVAAAMKCALCKSEFVIVKVPTFKGSTPETTLVERHACASCGNKWVTSGHGKAKVEVAKHTCGGCTI